MKNNKKKGLIVSSTVVGLVCGLALTQQQAKAATVDSANEQSSTLIQAPKADKETRLSTLSANVNSNDKTNADDSSIADTIENQPTATNGKDTDSNVSASNEEANKQTPTTKAATTPELIDQGTWGTSKWEYKHEGDDYVLYLHEGTLGKPSPDTYGYIGIAQLNNTFKGQLTKIKIDQGVVANQNSDDLFANLSKLTTIEGLSNLDTSNVTLMNNMFSNCSSLTSLDLSHFDTSKVIEMSCMFSYCSSLPSLDLSNFNTTNVTNMYAMFGGCSSLTSLDLSHFDTSNVSGMGQMFEYCTSLEYLNLTNFNTSKVESMSFMFNGCENLKSLDVSGFDTSAVRSTAEIFQGCKSLKSLDISNFDLSNTDEIYGMFRNCTGLTSINIGDIKTGNATGMDWMFENCSSLTSLDLSHFATTNAIHMDYMFNGCTSLTSLDISGFTFRNYSMTHSFTNCTKLNHLVLGNKGNLNNPYIELPDVPAVGTLVPGTNKKVTAPYWVATSGYEQGKQYTSEELMAIQNRDQVTTYDWVAAASVAETSTESKAVSRLINIHQPDDTTKTITQTAMIKRQVNTNEDGSIDYGAWSTATWEAYDVPVFAGYSASSKQIPAAVVDGQTQDQVVDIFYEPVEQTITVQYLDNGKVVGTQQLTGYVGETITPNYHVPAGYELAASPQPTIKVDATGKQVIKVNVNHKLVQSTEIKTFTRTINVHQPDGTIKTINQVAVVCRTVTIDQATGKRTTGSWHTDIWEKYRLPQITGYTPTKSVIPTKVINANSQNERVDVYYKANK
ncbi:BspA family leucine-rich repeat surface protein [Lactobacillus sp.]|uniref:BspA family leucine-rich repeat surface protein n=1 Tax=Lactobacillus sp. TaxID=1591 RepID=UPI0025CBB619|nr:BspA family leucine-rich repeat surface protein [Lactobacillus sp.]MCO6533814.1 BspA family leucine-rich repeat surface protein [Lactobacillus sp.]